MTRLACVLCGLYLAVFVWLAWWTGTTASRAPLWFTTGNAAAAIVLVIAVIQQLDNADLRYENTELRERETRRAAHADEAAEHQANAELLDACCERWWTSLGADHDPTCPHHTPRSSPA